MLRKVLAFTICICAVNVCAQQQPDTKGMLARGVLFYVPFEGTADAAVAVGRATPWAQRALTFVPGKIGRALHVSREPAQYKKGADGKPVKDVSGQSIIAYEALGNIWNRRGTLAFWIRTPWAGSDTDLLTGSSLSGPYVFSISSEGMYTPFFYLQRRKSFMDFAFHGTPLAGNLERFGSYGTRLVPLWKKDVWQHLAVTWDDRRGFALFFNGERIEGFEGKITWNLSTPDIIAPATFPLYARDLWPVSAPADFDELLIMNRPLEQKEIRVVMEGRYDALRHLTPEDWPFDPEMRREECRLGTANGRPLFRANEVGALTVAIRQIHVEEVDIAFHRRYTLIDGTEQTSVTFNDGGLPFARSARFQFGEQTTFDHVVSTMEQARGSYCFDEPSKPLATVPDGRGHIPVPRIARKEFGIFFKGDAIANEISFFDLHASPASVGTRHFIAGPAPSEKLGHARQVLLRWPHPEDHPALLTAPQAPYANDVFQRRALRHLFLVLDEQKGERFVEALRLVLYLRPAQPKFSAVIRIHDPLVRGRTAFDLDVQLESARLLDITIYPTGLVIPDGGRLVIQLTLDTDYELLYGGREPSHLEIIEGDKRRIGHELAQAILRQMWPSFVRRLNQNRFMIEGETEETNPIKRGLDLALKYDPGNAMAQSWYGWSRLRRWPAYDFSYLEKEAGPRWAVYLREAVRSVQAILYWWLDHRSAPNGYIIGAGNQWNDITDFYSTFVILGATVSDTRLIEALERYQDAHWNSGRMSGGYTISLTDLTHSLEEASEIQPNLEMLRPGVPRYFYRDLLTASNYSRWIGRNAFGHTHFRSNFFNAKSVIPTGVHGRDLCACEAATTPGRFIWWYNGHAGLAKLLTEYADSWLADILRETKTKPAGVIPSAVQFETDELFTDHGAKAQTLDMLMSVYALTGDPKYLEPVKILFKRKQEVSDLKWALTHSLNFVHYRALTGDTHFDDVLRQVAEDAYKSFKEDAFFQRGFEQLEGQALCRWVVEHDEDDLIEMLKYVIRNNRRGFIPYTITDPPTDRVYPWGREVLQTVMLGGRVFYFRASMPTPSAAFMWTGTDADVVSMVTEKTPISIKMLVHNFKTKIVEAGMRALQLPEGRYRLSIGPLDGVIQQMEIEMCRFTPARLPLPPGTTRVELACVNRRKPALLPDLAVTLESPVIDGKVVAQVHNLGCASAREVVVALQNESGRTIARDTIAEMPGLTGFEPQIRNSVLKPPRGYSADRLVLVVDPENRIEEINEANNEYPVRLGVPPAVESMPAGRLNPKSKEGS